MTPEIALVCVVDDDVSVRRAVQRLLRAAGYRVRVFASPIEFLAHDTAPDPDCAVVDIRMPGLGGFEMYERLRASGRSLPVVFITGHGDDTLAATAMQAGAVAFLAKPFGDTALLEAVARAVARKRQDPHHTPAGSGAA